MILSGAKVGIEIGEILAGFLSLPDQDHRPLRVIFKSVGMAVEDLAGAVLVYEGLLRKKF